MKSNALLPSEAEIERTWLEGNIPSQWLENPEIVSTLENLKNDQTDFLKKHPFQSQWPSIQEKLKNNVIPLATNHKSKSWSKIISVTFAMAAMLLLALYLNNQNSTYIGLKGSVDFGFYYFSAEDQRSNIGNSGTQLKVGDKIRFYFTSTEPVHLMIIGIEENGNINQVYPEQETQVALSPGDQQILAPTFQLDHFIGKEHFIAIFSKTELSYKEVKELISNTPESLSKIDTNSKLNALGQIKSFWIEIIN